MLNFLNLGPLSDSGRGLVSALSAVGVVNLVERISVGWIVIAFVQIVCGFVLVAYTEKEPPVDDSKKKE